MTNIPALVFKSRVCVFGLLLFTTPFLVASVSTSQNVWLYFLTGVIAAMVCILLYINRRLLALRLQAVKVAERLKEAQHVAHMGSWELDLINNKLTWSDEIFSIFEIDSRQFSASYQTFLNAVHPEDRLLVDSAFQDSVAMCQPYSVEHRLLMPDGRVKYVREEGQSFYDDSGTPLRSVGTVQDISDRFEQRRLLQESEERYQRFTQMTSDFVHICERMTDNTFRVRWLAGSVEKLTGYTSGEFMAMGCWLRVVHSDDLHETVSRLAKLQPGETDSLEFRILRKDGDQRWLRSNSYCTLDSAGRYLLYGTVADISERKHYEELILDSSFVAMEANRAKSEFLANMSHEIRTPMNGIVGMIQLLQFTELTQEQKDYLCNIEVSAENLLALINDILDLSKIEAGKIELAPIDFSLRDVIETTVKIQLPKIEARGLLVESHIADAIPDTLYGDDLRLKQILLNLLSNATKFTYTGKISIKVKLKERQGDQLRLIFSIQDSGIGICDDVLQLIFKPFCQGDSSMTRRFGGTGLGLTICRKLVDLMGGDIWVESEEGMGSTFSFELPLTASAQIVDRKHRLTETVLDTQCGPSLKVLLAEDNEINMRLTTLMLKRLGHSVFEATNGEEAVSLWHSAQVDVILMDVQMPDVDGVKALRIIRSAEEMKSRKTPVVALTAHALIGDRERFLAEGFNDYIAKPFNIDRLAIVLKGIAG